jgi:hypothetical protein
MKARTVASLKRSPPISRASEQSKFCCLAQQQFRTQLIYDTNGIISISDMITVFIGEEKETFLVHKELPKLHSGLIYGYPAPKPEDGKFSLPTLKPSMFAEFVRGCIQVISFRRAIRPEKKILARNCGPWARFSRYNRFRYVFVTCFFLINFLLIRAFSLPTQPTTPQFLLFFKLSCITRLIWRLNARQLDGSLPLYKEHVFGSDTKVGTQLQPLQSTSNDPALLSVLLLIELRRNNDSTSLRSPALPHAKKTTNRQDRALVRYADANPRCSLKLLATPSKSGVKLGRNTVRKILKVHGRSKRVPRKKPWLRGENRKRRLTWTRVKKKRKRDYNTVCWSDKVTYYVGEDNNIFYVTRKANEEFKE